MGRRIRGLLDWLSVKLDVPTKAERDDFYARWDYDQTNDAQIAKDDPFAGEIREALALRETDPSRAFRNLLGLAERGSVCSMTHVVFMLHNGEGTERDDATAEAWGRRAVEAGSLWALLSCGRFASKRGDMDACEEIYGVGAAMGWAPAMYWLAMTRLRRSLTRKTFADVKPLLEGAAAKGSPRALDTLALFQLKGFGGLVGIRPGIAALYALVPKETADHWARKI